LSINTAALTITGILAGAGIFVGHLFRTFGWKTKSGEKKPSERRVDLQNEDNHLLNVLENFKLIYRNDSGSKIGKTSQTLILICKELQKAFVFLFVETTLPKLITTIETTFFENNIDLSTCLHKAICRSIQKTYISPNSSTDVSLIKILDGLSNSDWIMENILTSSLRNAVKIGKKGSFALCDLEYHKCKWPEPDEMMLDLIKENIKFI